MTVGELARRTGLSRKAIRQFEGLGLIYSAGRSEANYRLFDESALWCVRVIRTLRSLGLTLREIQELAAQSCDRRGDAVAPHLAAMLDRAERRIAGRVAELRQTQRRIEEFRRKNGPLLMGTTPRARPRPSAATSQGGLTFPPG